jgi:hypothetical protein
MRPIDVSVDRIELFRLPRYRLQQGSRCRHRVGTGAPEAQRTWPDGVKLAGNKVMSWPSLTSSSTSHATTHSVPP